MPTNKEIITKNLSLLTDKGYFDRQIMSSNNPENFTNWFEKSLNIFREDKSNTDKTIVFAIPLTNWVNKNRHLLFFDLIYEYQPKLQDVFLKSISAYIGNNLRTYDIDIIPEDIPLAKDIYNTILDDLLNKPTKHQELSRRTELIKLSDENLTAINNICKEQKEILSGKGYLFTPSRADQNYDSFTNALQEKLATIANHPTTASPFIGLRTSRYFNNDTSKTTFRLIYAVKPSPLKVSLKAVHGKIDKWNYFKIISNLGDLPTAKYVHETMASRQLFINVRNKFKKIFRRKQFKN
jgi:hypothetical protein